MGWYVARRVAVMVPVFLGATLLIYGMVFLLPGDPVAALAGDRPLTPAVAAQLRSHYHLDDPFCNTCAIWAEFCTVTWVVRILGCRSVPFWRMRFRSPSGWP